jgi:hypothetical protein
VTLVSNAKITYSLVAIEKLGSLTLALPQIKSCAGEGADKVLTWRLCYRKVLEALA